MAPSVVQHAPGATLSSASGTTATLTATFGTALTAGNAVVACITVVGSNSVPAVTSVTTNGTAENWAHAKSGTADAAAGDFHTEIWVNPDTGGGQTAIKVNVSWASSLSSSDNGVTLADVYEVAGVAASSPADQTAASGNSGSGTTFTSTATGTTANASEIAFGVACAVNSAAVTLTGPASPWVNETKLTGTYLSADLDVSHLSGYDILSATGTQTYSGAQSSGSANSAAIVTLLPGITGPALTVAAAAAAAPALAPSAGATVALPAGAATAGAPAVALSAAAAVALTVATAAAGAPAVNAEVVTEAALPAVTATAGAPALALKAGATVALTTASATAAAGALNPGPGATSSAFLIF